MALVSVMSAGGSPGVSALALGMALTWHRPTVLVDADPTGGQPVLAGWLRGQVPPTGGVMQLLTDYRHGDLVEGIDEVGMRLPDTTVTFVPGVRRAAQAGNLSLIWQRFPTLVQRMDDMGVDVIADVGRIGLEGHATDLVRVSDIVLLVTGCTLPELSTTRAVVGDGEWARSSAQTRVVTVGASHPYGRKEVENVLQIPVLAEVPLDSKGAAVVAHGMAPGRRWQSSPYVRGVKAVSVATQEAIDVRRRRIGTEEVTDG